MTPLEFLAQLQAEAENGFHRKLQAWVDDNSSVARVLRDAEARSRENAEDASVRVLGERGRRWR